MQEYGPLIVFTVGMAIVAVIGLYLAGKGTQTGVFSRTQSRISPPGRAIQTVMARLNLTLDRETYAELERQAKRLGKARTKVVKEILCEGLARRTAAERRRRLARDYTAGRTDARALLKDLESPQFDLMADEEA